MKEESGEAAPPPRAGGSEDQALKQFLVERRARIRPENVGLPTRSRRKPAGLSRGDMAELLGVSPFWYALFESGGSRRRFSSAFLDRTAQLLQMGPPDRATFLRLVAASGSAAGDVDEGPARWVTFMGELAEMARKLAVMDDVGEASPLAFQTLGMLLASQPAFTLFLRSGTTLEAVGYAGPATASPIVGRTIRACDGAGYTEVARRGNRSVIIPDLCSDAELARLPRSRLPFTQRVILSRALRHRGARCRQRKTGRSLADRLAVCECLLGPRGGGRGNRRLATG